MNSHLDKYFPLAVLLLAATLGACSAGKAEVAATPPQALPLPVETTLPSRSEIFASLHATAALTTDADAPVVARVGGEVVEVLAEEGDRVSRGQLLARLDGGRLRLDRDEARAVLLKTEREYSRLAGLAERGLVSAASVESMKFDLDALRAEFEMKDLELEYTNMRATIDGVVSERAIKLGQHLADGTTAFRVTNSATLVAELRIPQGEISSIAAGDLATVRVDALPGNSFPARIERVSPTIDSRNGTFRATAYIDNPDGLLVPGMFARFDIAYDVHEDALVIPEEALVREDNETIVYVVADGAAERRIIEVGINARGMVEVIEGIVDGEPVVTRGQSSLRDGSRVLAQAALASSISG